jgi:hypothetical protein
MAVGGKNPRSGSGTNTVGDTDKRLKRAMQLLKESGLSDADSFMRGIRAGDLDEKSLQRNLIEIQRGLEGKEDAFETELFDLLGEFGSKKSGEARSSFVDKFRNRLEASRSRSRGINEERDNLNDEIQEELDPVRDQTKSMLSSLLSLSETQRTQFGERISEFGTIEGLEGVDLGNFLNHHEGVRENIRTNLQGDAKENALAQFDQLQEELLEISKSAKERNLRRRFDQPGFLRQTRTRSRDGFLG